MFWLGFLIGGLVGLFVGGTVGILIFACCSIASDADQHLIPPEGG